MPRKKSVNTKPIKTRNATINIALQNLIEGKATPSEITLLKQSLLEGEISIGGNIKNSVIITGSNNVVQLQPEALDLLNSKEVQHIPLLNQIPRLPTQNFIGRETELLFITERLKGLRGSNILVISGMAGVGKTTLVIMAVNQLKELFPDGIIFIDSRGRSADPLKPSEAMLYILRSLHQENVATLPADEILSFYRAFLKDKRILLIFDNVDSESQIESLLLPPPSQVIIISRQNIYFENSHQLNLNAFTQEEAIRFLTNKLDQISLSQEEALTLASACGYYPLALQYAVSSLQNLYITPKEFISSLPPEIFNNAQKDPTAIYTYFSRIVDTSGLERERKPEKTISAKSNLNESKILFVGQGSVGKTSLIKRIINDDFSHNETKTDGISISLWLVDNQNDIDKPAWGLIDRPPSKIRLNIWDFGGQEIMHATHQFFLTKRSLYLLVLDSRLTQEENRVEYWLKIIQSFGNEAPVLIVGNKIDQHPLDIDRSGLQRKYTNLIGVFETSAATGKGVETLRIAIANEVSKLPHIHTKIPQTWFEIKNNLEVLGRKSNFITHDKYLELCAENEVSDETSQRTLIGFLHDLGVILHFQDEPRLEALGILNPQWVTNGVYKILNSHTLFQNKGVLTVSMLDEILDLPEYPRGKRLFIVDMMKKFELCYDIEPDKTFLVPDLLPKDQPDLNFNGVPAFEYAYPVLPSSVITRFIVRMNQKIDDGLVWRTGVVLKIGDNKALVKADIEDRKITIAIDGLEHTRRDALLAVCTHLDEIHDSIKGLNPEKLIPVPGAVNAKPLSYNYLLMLEAKGVEVLPVPDSNSLIDVNIRKVLSGVPNEIRPKESASNVTTIYNVNTGGGDFTGGDKSISAGDSSVVIGGNMSGNLISGNYNKINSAEIDSELKDTLLKLGEAVDAMIQKLPAEQAAEVAEDFGKLADEAVKPKPNKKWYSVSIDGLIKAAENLDKLGTPVISLSRKVLSLLTGGVVK